MSIVYRESTARTNKLKCDSCLCKIAVGDKVIFELDEHSRRPMVGVHHFDCAPELQEEIERDGNGYSNEE